MLAELRITSAFVHRLMLLLGLVSGFGAIAQTGSVPEIKAESPSMRVLVAGGSGRTGIQVVRDLMDSDMNFVALTRDKERALERWGPDYATVTWIEGDVRDRLRTRQILQDVTHVICVIGSRQIAGPNSAEFVDYGGVTNLVDAAVEHGAAHFVLLTAIGTTDPAHPFNRISGGALEWRFKGEQHLRESGLNYTIVRPGGLTDAPGAEEGLRLDQGDNWREYLGSTLSRDDLAAVLVESLAHTRARNVTVEVVNDPDLVPGDWRDQFKNLSAD